MSLERDDTSSFDGEQCLASIPLEKCHQLAADGYDSGINYADVLATLIHHLVLDSKCVPGQAARSTSGRSPSSPNNRAHRRKDDHDQINPRE